VHVGHATWLCHNVAAITIILQQQCCLEHATSWRWQGLQESEACAASAPARQRHVPTSQVALLISKP
jgi:hypothetical protein